MFGEIGEIKLQREKDIKEINKSIKDAMIETDEKIKQAEERES